MGFFGPEFKKKVEKQITDSLQYRETLTQEQLNEIIPQVKAFYADKDNAGKWYFDGIRYFIIVITPTKDVGPPVETKYGGRWWLQTPFGIFITLFGSEKQFAQIGFNSAGCVTGKNIKTQYSPVQDDLKLLPEYQGKGEKARYSSSVAEMCRKFGLNAESITEMDYRKSYSMNIIQVVK